MFNWNNPCVYFIMLAAGATVLLMADTGGCGGIGAPVWPLIAG